MQEPARSLAHSQLWAQVLELGAGCGAVGLAALRLGARTVWLTDSECAARPRPRAYRLAPCARCLPARLPGVAPSLPPHTPSLMGLSRSGAGQAAGCGTGSGELCAGAGGARCDASALPQ